LTLILHEDHSDPLAHVDVSYHVGSNREQPGRSGFAHFFEHMMFEGSAHVPEGQHSKIISDAGGKLNGTTNSDRTNYYETIPVNQLEVALWLEADRMGFLLQAVDEKKFEVQRETVKNERGERVDNAPYGRVSEVMMKNLYPPQHPYSWPVIGWTADLEAATLDDLERFFLRWYGPNNAQLVIGGDIDPEQTLQWVAKYFGPIPRGPEVENLPKEPAELNGDRYATLEDNIHLPAVALLVPTVYYYHEDEAPLDAAAKILGQGKTSLLYQRLVETGRAVSAYVSHSCRELACEMAFVVVQNPASGETLAQMEAAIRETLAEFTERGVSQDDLDKFKAQIESGRIFSMQSVSGKVGALAYSELFNGDPKAVQDDLQRYIAVKPEDVTRVFKQYVENQSAVVLSVVPEGRAGMAAGKPNYTPPEISPGTFADGSTEKQLPTVSPPTPEAAPELRTVQDDFDRSVQPAPGINPLVQLPAIRDSKLANGVRVLSVSNDETPTVTLQVIFDMGQRDEPAGKAGLASLTAALMNEDSTQRSAAEFSEALERIGASIGVSSSEYESVISVNTLAKHLDQAMALLMERLLQPAFTEEDFERLKSRTMEGLLQAQKSGPALAGRATKAVLSGPTHPLSYPDNGLPSTLAGVTLDEVKAFYAANIPRHMKGVLVSTSLPQQDIDRVMTPLGELPIEPAVRAALDGQPEISGRTIYLVDKPGASQSSVRMAHPSVPFDAFGDYYLAKLMNFNLGGDFDSRINLDLREEKGWTYGAFTTFSGGREYGNFQFAAEIHQDATSAAITEVLGQIEMFARQGMTKEEFEYMQNAIGQSEALLYETPGRKLGLLGQALIYNLPLNFRSQQRSLLRETNRETLNALASHLLHPENLAIIVVGDAAKLRPQLEQLHWPIKMLDEEGFETSE
jgi:zinc protease